MTSATYGDHAEDAAASLQELIVSEFLPTQMEDVTRLLACRDAAINALEQRLILFGISPRHRPASVAAEPAIAAFVRMGSDGVALLDRVVHGLPRRVPDDRSARPSDVLGPRAIHPIVELWRRAAVELLAGSHALELDADQVWRRERGAAWHLIRDTATAIEALVVLDERLLQVGLFAGHDRPGPPVDPREARNITSHLAHMAGWFATDSTPDHAAPRLGGPQRRVGPVMLVSTPRDLIAAQRQLGIYLRPTNGHDVTYDGRPEINADTARQIIVSQRLLNSIYTNVATSQPRTTRLGATFGAREDVLADLQHRLRLVRDHRPTVANPAARLQQGEISGAIRRWRTDRDRFDLAPAELLNLAHASYEVTHNLALALRRETRRPHSNLGAPDPMNHERLKPITKDTALGAAITDLVHMPPPAIPTTEISSPLHRATLRTTLDHTTPEGETPVPFAGAMNPSVDSHIPGL